MRKKGNKFEDLIRKLLGIKKCKNIKKCINSGAFWFDKGDLETEDYLIECKYTEKGSYSVNKKLFHKIWIEALEKHKLPKIIIGIKDDKKILIFDCYLYKEAN